MELNDIKLGRIILFHGNAGISKKIQELTNNYWNHCSIYIGHSSIRESCFKGIVRTPLTHYLEGGGEFMVVKLKEATDEDQKPSEESKPTGEDSKEETELEKEVKEGEE